MRLFVLYAPFCIAYGFICAGLAMIIIHIIASIKRRIWRKKRIRRRNYEQTNMER